MKEQNKHNPLLDQANEILISLAPQVTTDDRKAAMEKYGPVTICRYLKGRALDLDTALDLIEIFQERIRLRKERLKKAQAA
jgi:hypothetical protein